MKTSQLLCFSLLAAFATTVAWRGSFPSFAADARGSETAVEEDATSEPVEEEASAPTTARQRRKTFLQQHRQTRREARREHLEKIHGPQARTLNDQGSLAPAPPPGRASDLSVSFKLDPRITRGLYMGDRWVSPPTYTGVQDGTFVVEARVEGRDSRGRPVAIKPKWTSSDPALVSASPGEGTAVTITVHRAGESRLQITVENAAKEVVVSKELPIKAAFQGTALQVEIDTTRSATKGVAHADEGVSDRAGRRPVVKNGWRWVE